MGRCEAHGWYNGLRCERESIAGATTCVGHAERSTLLSLVEGRDAEIAALNLRVAQLTSGSEAANLAGRVVEQDAEIARLRAALAAGPAALRAKWADYRGGIVKGAYDDAAQVVERAQEAAMKEGT